MNEFDFNYFEMINKAISRSNRLESNLAAFFEEWKYYDEYNNITMKKIKYANNDITYEIYDNTYDQLGNATVKKYTCIVNNQAFAYEDTTFYEYIYDEKNNIILGKTFNQEHKLCEMIRNEYRNNNLAKREVYKDIDDDTYSNGSDYTSKHLKKVHFYSYGDNGRLLQEKVCLPSGEICCYIKYEKTGKVERVENPFKSRYSWSIDSIHNGSYEVSVKESVFNDEILKDIVDSLCGYYKDCHWILLDLSGIRNRIFDEEKVNEMMKLYERDKQIIFNYI